MRSISYKDFKSFIKRIITTLIMLPIGIFVVFSDILNGLPLFLFIIVLNIFIMFEVFTLVERRFLHFFLWITSFASTITTLNFFFYGIKIYDAELFIIISITIIMTYLLIINSISSYSKSFDYSIYNISISFYYFFVLSFSTPFIGLLKISDLSGWRVAIFLFIIFMSDAGGLFFGKLFGKHKIPLLSSPNKTIEGYIGSFIFGLFTSILLYFLQRPLKLPVNFSIFEILILATICIIFGFIGDLSESVLKRWANAKDSGDFLPGHGGIFDRFDSIIFAAPIYYVIMKLLGY